MSKLSGGLFSSPSGHNNGLVFGKGRTKDGKKTTVRELVKPSNPRTTAQTNQRNRFTAALQIVKSLGRAVYQIAWNSGVGDLPGFHSMQSRFTDALSNQGQSLSPPESTTLGVRHFPATFAAAAGTDVINVTWSTETGDVGASDDKAIVLAIEASDTGPDWDRITILDESATRTDGLVDIPSTGVAAGDYVVGLYFQGVGTSIPSGQEFSEANFLLIS